MLVYDSVTGNACPRNAAIVAGYVDGSYGPNDPYGTGWSQAAWELYPNAYHVTITVTGTPGARVADCEPGTAMYPPANAANWAKREIAAGRRPTIYADLYDWSEHPGSVDQALAAVGLERGRDVDGWVADVGPAKIPAGFVACQYAQGVNVGTGHNVDISVTNGTWPQGTPPLPPTPAPVPNVQIMKPLAGKVGKLNAPVVAVVPTWTGKGYSLVCADGGTFQYGDAPFLGSLAGQKLNAPIVDAARTPDGNGLVLVATDGGVFTFGDAKFEGSEGGQKLNAPVVSIGITPDGNGYWLTASDGGVFTFGDAPFAGSAA